MYNHIHNLVYRYRPCCGIPHLSYIEGIDNFDYKFYNNDKFDKSIHNKKYNEKQLILRYKEYEGIETAIIPYDKFTFNIVYSPLEIDRIYGRY